MTLSSNNVELSGFLAQKLDRELAMSRRNFLLESSKQANSPDHIQRLPLSNSVSYSSTGAPERSNDWGRGKEEGSASLSELRDTEEPHISATTTTMTSNFCVAETTQPTSTEPIVFELNQIEFTRSTHIYAQAQSNLTPSRSQDSTLKFSQAATGLAPMSRYLA